MLAVPYAPPPCTHRLLQRLCRALQLFIEAHGGLRRPPSRRTNLLIRHRQRCRRLLGLGFQRRHPVRRGFHRRLEPRLLIPQLRGRLLCLGCTVLGGQQLLRGVQRTALGLRGGGSELCRIVARREQLLLRRSALGDGVLRLGDGVLRLGDCGTLGGL